MILINNKVLVSFYIPVLNQEYECFVPIGKTVGTIKSVVLDMIAKLNEIEFTNSMSLINKESNTVYDDNALIVNCRIKNGMKLLII